MKTQEKEMRKKIRKEASRVGWGITIYTILVFSIVMISFIAAGVNLAINYPEATEQDAIYLQVMEQCEASGTSSIIGVCLGVLFLCFFFRKSVNFSTIMQKERDMNAATFIQILCIFLGVQTFFSLFSGILESGLNLIGYSAMENMESATAVSSTISMFLYASVFGPIVEELAYRGFVLRSLQKYGKVLAVVISAILFGVMHANVPQGFFAFGVGLVLGYVAIEYSVKWAILLHVINNCIYSDLFGWVLSRLSEQMRDIVSSVVLVILGVAAVLVLMKKRSVIKEFIFQNRTEKRIYFCVLSAMGMIVFIVGEVLFAINMLEKL